METRGNDSEKIITYVFEIAKTTTELKTSCAEYNRNLETADTFLDIAINSINGSGVNLSGSYIIPPDKRTELVAVFNELKTIIVFLKEKKANEKLQDLMIRIEQMVSLCTNFTNPYNREHHEITPTQISVDRLELFAFLESNLDELKKSVIDLNSNIVYVDFQLSVKRILDMTTGTSYKDMIFKSLNPVSIYITPNLELPDKLISYTDFVWAEIKESLKSGKGL